MRPGAGLARSGGRDDGMSSTRARMRSCSRALETVVGLSRTRSSGEAMRAAKSMVRRCPPELRQPGVGLRGGDGVKHPLTLLTWLAAVSWTERSTCWSLTFHLAWSVQLCWTSPTLTQKPAPWRDRCRAPVPAGGRGQRAQQVLHEGRLAHAVGAEQADDLPASTDRPMPRSTGCPRSENLFSVVMTGAIAQTLLSMKRNRM